MTIPHCKCGERDPAKYYPSMPRQCKACLSASAKAWREAHLESSKLRARDYMRNHPEQARLAQKRWYDVHAAEHTRRQIAYTKAHRDEANAHNLALAHLKEIQPCAAPGCTSKAERHHPDYSKPLEVIWLCRRHHKRLHAGEAVLV